jgi:hypothetical protein
LETFPHPAQSPDINLVEHVWKQFKVLVNKRPIRPASADALWVALQEEWLNIDHTLIIPLLTQCLIMYKLSIVPNEALQSTNDAILKVVDKSEFISKLG